MKKYKTIFTRLSAFLLVLCCGAILLMNWSLLGYKTLSVPTGSMRPTITPGSLVLVHRVPSSSLKVGDIITYINPLDPKLTISHRIVKTYLVSGKVRAFVTKGDANKFDDVPITSGSILGQVTWHVSNVGGWLLDIKKPIIILPILYVAAGLLMIEEATELSQYLKSLQPYRLRGFSAVKQASKFPRTVSATTVVTIILIIIGGFIRQPVLALLQSNTVSLVSNNLSVPATTGSGSGSCPGNNNSNTNISVNSSSSQTATSGSVTTSGNTTGGTGSSGSASNSSSTNINISVTNC